MPKPKLNLTNVSKALRSNTEPMQEANASRISKSLEKLSQPAGRNTFDVKYIPLEIIQRNEKNTWPIINIDSLEDSILHFGLLEALSGFYVGEKFVLESGERRYTAINNLVQKYSDPDIDTTTADYKCYKKNVEQFALQGIPCKIEANTDPLYSEARLKIANLEKRPDDPAFLAKEIYELSVLYEKINAALPEDSRFSINNRIAADLGLGTRQVIRNKQFGSLTPELQAALVDTAGINEGSRYHVLPEDAQKKLAEDINATGIIPDVDTAKVIYEKPEAEIKEASSSAPETDILDRNRDAISKEVALKKSIKALNKAYKKAMTALSDYESIDESIIKSLDLKPSEAYRDDIFCYK